MTNINSSSQGQGNYMYHNKITRENGEIIFHTIKINGKKRKFPSEVKKIRPDFKNLIKWKNLYSENLIKWKSNQITFTTQEVAINTIQRKLK